MVRWQWQKDLRKKDEDEEGVFEDYGPADNAKLEAAYKKGLNTLEFGKLYNIDFKHMIQYRVADKERQRPIRRIEDEPEPEPEPEPEHKTKKRTKKGSIKPTVLWLWKKDLRLKDDRPDAWTLYEGDTRDKIEAAYQADKGDTFFKLDKNRAINFEDMCQFRIGEPTRQRPVKRLVGEAPKKNDSKDDSDSDDEPLTSAAKKKAKKDFELACLVCAMAKAADKMKLSHKNDIRICFACDKDTGDVVRCKGCDDWWHMDGECACGHAG